MTDGSQPTDFPALSAFAQQHSLEGKQAQHAFFVSYRSAALDGAGKAEKLVPKIMWSPKALAALSGPLSQPLNGLRGALKAFDQSYGKRGTDQLPEAEPQRSQALHELYDIVVRSRDAAEALNQAIEEHYAEKGGKPDVFNKVQATLREVNAQLQEGAIPLKQ
ncbi:hypothetical protein [Carnimonas nigrificans]|uniref:hypothetical protein n=1 Tax=Carnimonas nigrificans TaxID=64323 RepID=UPI00047089FB|nr:hypothetical protein [Carnimonas nigrificans]